MAAVTIQLHPQDAEMGRTDEFAARAERAAAVAAAHADHVDRLGRFPSEAMSALKAEKRLSMMVPESLGGDGAGIGDVMDVCYRLGQACSSTALIFAMHQIKAACIIRHAKGAAWHENFLRRLARHELLLASSTTEGQGGGDVRTSIAPLTYDGLSIELNRDATVVSYGRHADALVTTARRAPDALPSDQVLVVFEYADYTLSETQRWDSMGMRGTDSSGFNLFARGGIDQILPDAYADIHSATMVPVAHLLWSSAWAGIAAGAVERARLFVRKAARGGQTPPGAVHFGRAAAQLRQLTALLSANRARFEAIADDAEAMASPDFQTAINMLKVDASEAAVATVMSAMRACGLSGYRNDSDVSIARSLRDILSAPLMINNERIVSNLAQAVMLAETPLSLRP